MSSASKTKLLGFLSLVFNVSIFIITVIAVLQLYFAIDGGNMTTGRQAFRYFTVLSNMLVGLCSLLFIPFNLFAISIGEDHTPYVLRGLKFSATIAVTLTMVTALAFLSILYGFKPMIAGSNLYMHLITPLLAIITFVLFENKRPLSFAASFWCLVPVVFYAIVYFSCVVIVPVWPDFYGFTFGYRLWAIPISFVVMLSVTYLFGFIIFKL